MATWARFVPCCQLEARPVVLGRWRCPRCGCEHPDAVVTWRELRPADVHLAAGTERTGDARWQSDSPTSEDAHASAPS